ncbi:uncharacterized protein LOC117570917 [Drosophila albomicans]|uniref:Uncharacterized protein LOC117570917 n=1 Tax=Drosophila albomicans TaxID=7291 RepID=A0A6P8WY63_DROAB|nr:uncharacterized protein LOC117570917 [Drosophila albomicans]
MKRERVASLCLLGSLLISICSVASAAPHSKSDDIIMVEDIVSLSPGDKEDTNVALITMSESNSSEEDSSSASKEDNASDDLIFLTRKSQTSNATQTQTKAHVDSSASEEELEEEETTTATSNVSPIDMSAFVALIPTQQVHAIVSDYHRNDAEVQRAYRILSSRYFAEKKQLLIQLPEVQAFTRYLNASGLDVLKLVKDVLRAIGPSSTEVPTPQPETATESASAPAEDISSSACNDVAFPPDNLEPQTNSTREQVKGLQGLVDSVLEALPQDQILATFFDKIEADQQFSKLIDSIGTPKFSKILSNLQNSVPLRYQLGELQKCRINIGQIVESLKSYFFLSSF